MPRSLTFWNISGSFGSVMHREQFSRFGWFSFLAVLKVEVFSVTLLSWFNFLTCCSIFLIFVYLASETWVGALLEKLSWLSSKPSQVKFHITRRCSIVPLRSTGQLLSRVFVVLLRKSIPQSRNLKAAAELNVRH